jgi:ATP-dependent Clp protease ATP-binding subunit ClpC
MTSNVGANSIVEPKRLGFTSEAEDDSKMQSGVMDALKRTFRPEFINRLDEIIVFNKLTDENIRAITSLMLRDVARRIEEKGIAIDFDDAVVAHLAKEGFDPVYGARPLRRAIVRTIEDSFSEELLCGRAVSGDKIKAVMIDGKIAYEKEC